MIAAWGVPPVFAINAACTLFLIVALLAWRRPPATRPVARERFLPALRAGGRYVRHEPVVRLILLRLAIFVAPATAMWALLPLIANRQLGLGADGYGILFGALGVGAITAAFTVGTHRPAHVGERPAQPDGRCCTAIAFALTMVVPGLLPAIPLLIVARLRLDGDRRHPERRAAAVPARLGAGPGGGGVHDDVHRLRRRSPPRCGA